MKKIFPNKLWHCLLLILGSLIIAIPIILLIEELPLHIDAKICLDFITLCLSVYFIAWYVNKRNKVKLGLSLKIESKDVSFILKICCVVLVYLLCFRYLSYILGIELSAEKDIFIIITATTIAPALEELMFRGVILNGLLSRYSKMISIIISSFLFAIIHINVIESITSYQTISQVINAFILGCLLGWTYTKTRSLGVVILIHIFANALGIIFSCIFI